MTYTIYIYIYISKVLCRLTFIYSKCTRALNFQKTGLEEKPKTTFLFICLFHSFFRNLAWKKSPKRPGVRQLDLKREGKLFFFVSFKVVFSAPIRSKEGGEAR